MKRFTQYIVIVCLSILSLGFTMQTGFAQENRKTIIPQKSEWRYHNEGPNQFPGDTWFEEDYDDSSWKLGKGILGYKHDQGFDTKLSYGDDKNNKYLTYFFRKTFELSENDLKSASNAILEINADDAAVVFINNKIVHRYNYPEGPIDYTKGVKPIGTDGKRYIETQHTTEALNLKSGLNTMAVVVFQQKPTSSDIAFDAGLQLEVAAKDIAVSRVNTTFYGDVKTQKALTWHTNDSSRSDVRYVQSETKPNNLEGAQYVEGSSKKKTSLVGYTHRAILTQLSPDSNYYYQVGNKEANVWSPIAQFKTGNARDGVQVGFITDSQGWETNHYAISGETMRRAQEQAPNMDFFVQGGDLVNTSSLDKEWHDLFEEASDVWSQTTVMPVSGNHDTHSQTFDEHYTFDAPSQGRGRGTYYSFDYENVHFAMLNTGNWNANGLGNAQTQWLIEDLKQAKANGQQWLVVVMHKGIQTVGSHIDDTDVRAMRKQLQPIFTEYDVDLVLQGHDHVYSRSVSLDGAVPETNFEIFDNKGTKTLVNPKGVSYVNGNTSGVKFYNPMPADRLAQANVYPDVQSQNNQQTYLNFNFDDKSMNMEVYSFDAKTGGESVKIDEFSILKDDATLLDSKMELMGTNVSEQAELFESIQKAMNQKTLEERKHMGFYSQYLQLLKQVQAAFDVSVEIDGNRTELIYEVNEMLHGLEEPSKEGHRFKGWMVNETFFEGGLEAFAITEKTDIKAVFEVIDVKPWTPLTPSEKPTPWTPLTPSEKPTPWTPLTPSEKQTPWSPLTPSEKPETNRPVNPDTTSIEEVEKEKYNDNTTQQQNKVRIHPSDGQGLYESNSILQNDHEALVAADEPSNEQDVERKEKTVEQENKQKNTNQTNDSQEQNSGISTPVIIGIVSVGTLSVGGLVYKLLNKRD